MTLAKHYNWDNPHYYLNRELSLLQFNLRVLEQALDEHVPLLERLRFVFICSENVDEFFEIRVADLKQRLAFGKNQAGPDGLTPSQALNAIYKEAHALSAKQYQILNNVLIPALEKQQIRFISDKDWNSKQKDWIYRYFLTEILPVVSPIGLDLAHPLPRLVNKSLNFVVALAGKDAFGRESSLAIIHAPRSLPRIIRLPDNIAKPGDNFILLADIVKSFVSELFPGMQIKGCYQFRLTRNSDLFLDEITDDLALALKAKLLNRRYGNAVRLEIANDCPQEISQFLLDRHNLTQDELFKVAGPVNLSRLMKLLDLVDKPELRYPAFNSGMPKRLQRNYNLFSIIRHGDILLHHPFQSFLPVVDFIRQATLDPKVLAIKQTLYRTGVDSLMVRALADAAKAGKEVTAVIELRARFDEEYNLELANRLQEAGVLVVYGVMKFKTHAKMILIVRREGNQLRRYCHIGTGNYHANTARQYTDYGLLTCDPVLCEDVHNVFQELTGMSKALTLKKLLAAPFSLAEQLLDLIDFEIVCAKRGEAAHIIAKLNALTEQRLIIALYRASQAGVKIDLIVRGICCLKPGLPGVSENIHVYSVLGRFLEHERIYYFYHGGDEKVFCSSADWMERNLYHRVEVCFPIENKRLAMQVKRHGLLTYLQDNVQNWELDSKGHYQRRKPKDKKVIIAQQILLNELANA